MKNKKVIIIVIIVIIIGSYLTLILFDAPPMLNMAHGDLILTLESPNKRYDLLIYHGTGGATVADWITADIFDKSRNKKYTIYYCYRQTHANAEWIDDKTIIINETILDVHRMRYNSKWDN